MSISHTLGQAPNRIVQFIPHAVVVDSDVSAQPQDLLLRVF